MFVGPGSIALGFRAVTSLTERDGQEPASAYALVMQLWLAENAIKREPSGSGDSGSVCRQSAVGFRN